MHSAPPEIFHSLLVVHLHLASEHAGGLDSKLDEKCHSFSEVSIVTEEQILLSAAQDGTAQTLADKIHNTPSDSSAGNLTLRRALLAEALNCNYSRQDLSFTNLMSWQNKTSYLVLVALGLICTLSAAFPDQSVLFLLGALGGFVSRLSRSLERNDVPTDYGASWTTLFLGPISGALGAWAGVLLMGLAIEWQVVGTTVKTDWINPGSDVRTLAIAFLFGFSERLLDTVLDALQKKTLANNTSAAAQPARANANNPNLPAQKPATNRGAEGGPGKPLPAATVGVNYTGTLSAANVPDAILWTPDTGESLPEWLKLDQAGGLTGVPPAGSVGKLTFHAKAGNPAVDPSYEFTLQVNAS